MRRTISKFEFQEEPYELDMFERMGFQRVSLGSRVLRSDVAVVSLLALAHEACASDSGTRRVGRASGDPGPRGGGARGGEYEGAAAESSEILPIPH